MKDFNLTTFSDLHLAEPLLKALSDEGYASPTPIQAKAIPPVLEGRDLLGIAQTGTGKTAAFALPILHRLAANRRPAPRKGCRVLVLSPTRELCSQIADSFRAYGRHLGITVAVVFGGVGHRPQIQTLSRGVDVLVAAPGRLIDLMEQRAADLSGTEIFVLDEADQMLDLGFVKPIRRIVSQLSHRRQNLFFSATMPTEIAGLANELLNDPIKVAVAPVSTTAERVNQRVILVEASRKRAMLSELLVDTSMSRTLVFTRTKRGADRVARHLETGGTKVAAIHGNKSQRQREIALEDFKRGRITVLVATDIAARGIDVDLVTHVVNFELPEVPEAYVHRIGRTARAGASGVAISLCDAAERDLLRAIEKLTRQQIPHEDRRGTLAAEAEQEPERRGARGHRGGGGQPQRNSGAVRNGTRHDSAHRNGGGQRQGEGRRADGGGHRDGGHRDAGRNGDARANGHARGGEQRDSHRHNGDAGQRRPQNGNGHSAQPRSHKPDGHANGHVTDGNQPRRRERRDDGRNEASAPIGNVAFLARPTVRGPRRADRGR